MDQEPILMTLEDLPKVSTTLKKSFAIINHQKMNLQQICFVGLLFLFISWNPTSTIDPKEQ